MHCQIMDGGHLTVKDYVPECNVCVKSVRTELISDF